LKREKKEIFFEKKVTFFKMSSKVK